MQVINYESISNRYEVQDTSKRAASYKLPSSENWNEKELKIDTGKSPLGKIILFFLRLVYLSTI